MTGIIYGSSTGNTEKVACIIKKYIPKSVLQNIKNTDTDFINKCSLLILGTSTWGMGKLQDDWEDKLSLLKEADLTGKKIAIFGLGDQVWHDSFVDAMGLLYRVLKDKGAEIIGHWENDSFEFSRSRAFIDGKFVGLALDEINQPHLTEKRVSEWVKLLN